MHVGYAVVLLLMLTAGCARVKPATPTSEPQIVAKQPAAPPPAAEPPTAPPTKPPAPATPQPATKPAAPPPAPPQPVAKPTPPPTPQPVAKPAAPATLQPKPGAAPAARPTPPLPPAESKAAPPPAKTPPATPALDLNALKEELKETSAIGFFTKITLKNQVDDLLDEFREYYQGKSKRTKTDLRRSYDLLIMKVLSLLQDEDQKLASAVVSSREAIWDLLADPKKFATLPS